MNYYEWLGEPDAVDVEFPEDDYNGWWMVEDRPVTDWDCSLRAVYHGANPVSFHFGMADNSWPVMSAQMCQLLKGEVDGSIQCLPFQLIMEEDGTGHSVFSVVQFLHSVDCLDRRRTRVRGGWHAINDRGDFATFRPIVLSDKLIGNQKVFRIKGQCRSIVVRQDLKDAIEAAGFMGQRFDRLEVT